MTSSYKQPAAEFPLGTYFTQQRGGECRWIERRREELLAALASETPPEFRSVAAITQRDGEGNPTHYVAPFYADFDGEDIAEATEAFQKFLRKLEALGLDLAAVRLYATGGRGFHIEIPPALFLPMIPPEGIEHLPKIFKELALALYIDCMDLAVYSGRKGRMWRVPGVRRDNGAYKVPLTVAEALAMTPELYESLCSAPRPHPELAPANYCASLGLLYVQAKDKAHAKATRKRKAGKAAQAMKTRFAEKLKLPLPPSLLGLAQGAFPARQGVGFNRVVLQLCTVAHALGTSEEDLVALCRGLIEKHEGDGHRYGTPRRREAELRRMFAYTEGAPYDPSIGGIRSILPSNFPGNDLRGL